jgi:dihydrofolate reductase
MKISIIAAVAADRGIGRHGDLAFHISADLKRFKALTTGHTVIMGRKTFESLPKGALPNRRNIVVTRNAAATFPGAATATSIAEAIDLAQQAGETDAFIIGGAQIYEQSLQMADCLEITAIELPAVDADAFFPEISATDWELSETTDTIIDEKSQTPYRFQTYQRHR